MSKYRSALIGYYVTLALLVAGAFLPNGRFWGINGWSYFPIWAWSLIATIMAILPLVLDELPTSLDQTSTARRFWMTGLLGIAVCITIFSLCANRTHFLGDGLQILYNLRTGTVTHMIWNVPAEQLEAGVLALVGGNTESDALLALRLISSAAGGVAMAILLRTARRLGLGVFDSWLFCLGVISAGIGMFYFGYAETYPPFILMSIAVFVFGLLAATGELSRWWVFGIWLAAVALHLFAIAFLPAIVYLLVRPTRVWERIIRWPRVVRYGLLGIAVAAGAALIGYQAMHRYEIRFMFVPPMTDRFTIEGYTLFSANHFADLLNLMILLMPATLVFLSSRAGMKRQSPRTISPAKTFCLIATLGAGALIFVFDPKLGMLRDWDLFAFASIPVIVYWTYHWLAESKDKSTARAVVILAIALNLAVLAPRVGVAMSQERSFAMVDRIFKLDKTKSRSLHYLAIEYFRNHGFKVKGDSLQTALTHDFPELKIMEYAVRVYNEGDIEKAIALADLARSKNPATVDPYTLLCAAYSALDRLSEALEIARIAFGMNPYNADISYNMANIYGRMGKSTESRACIEQSLEIQPDHLPSMYAMATLAVAARNRAELRRWMPKLAVNDSVDASKFGDLVFSACTRSMFDEAAELLRFGAANNLDTAVVAEILKRYPDIQARLK